MLFRVNDQDDAQGRNRAHHISDHRESGPEKHKARIPLCPRFQGIRRDEDDNAEDGQPVIAYRPVRGTSAAPEFHGKPDGQENGNKKPVQQFGSHTCSLSWVVSFCFVFSHIPDRTVKLFFCFLPIASRLRFCLDGIEDCVFFFIEVIVGKNV